MNTIDRMNLEKRVDQALEEYGGSETVFEIIKILDELGELRAGATERIEGLNSFLAILTELNGQTVTGSIPANDVIQKSIINTIEKIDLLSTEILLVKLPAKEPVPE